jgi:hypothetical protein
MNSSVNNRSMPLWRAALVLVLCGALVLQGCSTCGRTRLLSTIGGTALGAATGYLFGGTKGAIIGALAGTAAGFLVGTVVCVEERRAAAQKAAHNAKPEEAKTVVKKYRAYNEELEGYVTNLQDSVTEIKSGKLKTNEVASAREATLTNSVTVLDGGTNCVTALRDYEKRVETAKDSTLSEAERQKYETRIQELDAEEKRLLSQLDQINALVQQGSGS